MMDTKEFKVNKFLTLKLEETETIIYVKGKRFNQCKFLLLDVPLDKITSLDAIESIDEAAEKLDKSLDPPNRHKINKISPEVEFWGHCSNLQVWYEENYNTNLIHSNLAFPLLKKLIEVGDSLAERVFKEEIAKRLSSKSQSTILFLLEEYYYSFLTPEEFSITYQNLASNTKNLIKVFLTKKFGDNKTSYEMKDMIFKYLKVVCSEKKLLNYQYVECNGKKAFMSNGLLIVKNVKTLRDIKGLRNLVGLKELRISQESLSGIEGLEGLKDLEILNLNRNKIKHIIGLDKFTNLRILDLSFNDIEEITGLKNHTTLEELDLSNNRITEIKGLECLNNLKKLDLSSNDLIERIEGLDSLKKLEFLNFNHNKILKIEGLDNLENLQVLILDHNNIKEIEGLTNLKNLQILRLERNCIEEIKGLEELEKLEKLNLGQNEIKEMKGLEFLKCLKFLYLKENEITVLKGLNELRRLQGLSLGYNQISEIEEQKGLVSLQYVDLSDNKLPGKLNRLYEYEEIDMIM